MRGNQDRREVPERKRGQAGVSRDGDNMDHQLCKGQGDRGIHGDPSGRRRGGRAVAALPEGESFIK